MADEPKAKSDNKEEAKIIADDDWKTQAQAEKEKLAEELDSGKAEGEGAGQGPREIPPASFVSLVGSIVTQIFMSLGGYEDPETKKRLVDLDLAKHHIDTLTVIEEKTAGNLSDEEKKILDQALYETRMQYVQMAQRVGGMQG